VVQSAESDNGASSASVQVATLLAVACGASIALVAFFFACRTAHLKGQAVHAAQQAKLFEEPIVTALQGPRAEESAAVGFADITKEVTPKRSRSKGKVKRKAKTKPAENGEEETVDVVVEGRETVETSAVDMEVDPAAPVPQSTTRATASIPEERRQGSEVVNDSSISLSSDVLHKKTKVKCKAKVKKKVKKPIDEISPEGHLVIDVSDTMSSEMVEGAISLEEVAFEEAISFSAPGDLPWHSHVHGDRGDVSGTQAPEQKNMKKIPKDKEKKGLDAGRGSLSYRS